MRHFRATVTVSFGHTVQSGHSDQTKHSGQSGHLGQSGNTSHGVKLFILISRVSQQVGLTDPPQHPLGKPGRRESLPQHCLKPPHHQNVHHQHGPQDIFLQPHRGLPGKQSLTHNKYSEMQMMAKLQKAVWQLPLQLPLGKQNSSQNNQRSLDLALLAIHCHLA